MANEVGMIEMGGSGDWTLLCDWSGSTSWGVVGPRLIHALTTAGIDEVPIYVYPTSSVDCDNPLDYDTNFDIGWTTGLVGWPFAYRGGSVSSLNNYETIAGGSEFEAAVAGLYAFGQGVLSGTAARNVLIVPDAQDAFPSCGNNGSADVATAVASAEAAGLEVHIIFDTGVSATELAPWQANGITPIVAAFGGDFSDPYTQALISLFGG